MPCTTVWCWRRQKAGDTNPLPPTASRSNSAIPSSSISSADNRPSIDRAVPSRRSPDQNSKCAHVPAELAQLTYGLSFCQTTQTADSGDIFKTQVPNALPGTAVAPSQPVGISLLEIPGRAV